MTTPKTLASTKDAIVSVGEGGRGFLLAHDPWPHYVITAAHCLPHLPPAHPASHAYERTYAALLGPLGGAPTLLWAECLFVDPIADIAVLCGPDGDALSEHSDAYDVFMEERPGLHIAAVEQSCSAWVLTLNGEWERCTVDVHDRALTLHVPPVGNAAGMSGSPIVTDDGHAIGIVNVGTVFSKHTAAAHRGQTRLASALPGWLLAEVLPQRGRN